MEKIQLSHISLICTVLLFIFVILAPSSSASASGSLPGSQEDSTPEQKSLAPPNSPSGQSKSIIAMYAHIQNFITDAEDDVKRALELASIKGDKEVVFYLLGNKRIDGDDVNRALLKASPACHKEIVSRLLKDLRIMPLFIKLSFGYAVRKGQKEMVLLFILKSRLDSPIGWQKGNQFYRS